MTNHFRRLSQPIQADPDDMRHLHISRILYPNREPNFDKPQDFGIPNSEKPIRYVQEVVGYIMMYPPTVGDPSNLCVYIYTYVYI